VEVMAFSMIIKTASLPCRRLLSWMISTSHWHHSLFVKAFEIITTTFHEFCRKWSTFPLIVSPASKYMTSPLRTLLDSTSHLRYKRGVGEDLFWKAVTEGIRKPIGQSPISEL
jgi:predicted glycoside hydrolase/deacetylase ChbG (UPF0249 family)